METKHPSFSLFFFLWTNLLTLVAIFTIYKIFWPSLWAAQLAYPLVSFVLTFVLAQFSFAFVEYFFHRYILHTKTNTPFDHFYTKHTHHHSLTDVAVHDERYHNEYPIMVEEQLESSFFPWYSLGLFSFMFTPILVAAALIINAPVLVSGYLAILSAVMLYEIIHQLFHQPLSWWRPLLDHPRWGFLWKRVYAFHLDHHKNPGCNESVAGFFGLPVGDFLFGTYHFSGHLFPHQEHASEATKIHRPRWLIRKLDTFFGIKY